LPAWILPPKFDNKKHRQKLKLVNPANANLISGDTMNPNFGRGARKTAILFDELGFWDYAKDAWEGTADSTECRIANSTPTDMTTMPNLKIRVLMFCLCCGNFIPLKHKNGMTTKN